jgi:15-cis-phytoene synthase
MESVTHPNEVEPKDEILRLSCAFIDDETKRKHVLAILAFAELLREVPSKVSEPLLGDIRYTWWIEALEEIRDKKKVRYHPLSAALDEIIHRYNLPSQAFISSIEVHRGLLEGPISLKEAVSIADQGAGALGVIAAQVLGVSEATTVLPALRFYILAGFRDARILKSDALGEVEVPHLKRDANHAIKGLKSELLPLVLPACLAQAHFQGQTLGPLKVRFKLFMAYLFGRI